jgi:hypothetical protein
VGGKMAKTIYASELVITDLKRRIIVDILPDRQKQTLLIRFSHLAKIPA